MDDSIFLLIGSAALLKNGNNYLLMKRSLKRKIAPNVWSCVGGKMEKEELNDPLSTCFREIEEETGIKKKNIYNLNLRYIIIRQAKNIIRHNYIYIGETDVKSLIKTDEGTLHWIQEEKLLLLEYTYTHYEMIKHYLQNKSNEKIMIGIAGKNKKGPKINWLKLEDFE
jgi:8-oxo-dGTP diphosphatase